jgi:hypothetical protein
MVWCTFGFCRSVGSKSQGDLGCFHIHWHGARIYKEPINMTMLHNWEVGGKWWQPCPSRLCSMIERLAVFIDQIQPPIKWQKGEKLANLVTYAFTINQVPHVFGDYYFCGSQTQIHVVFTKRRFPNIDLHKRDKGDVHQIKPNWASHHGALTHI